MSRRLTRRFTPLRSVHSWVGWPVPRRVRVASVGEVRALVAAAERHGYSRRASDLDLEVGETFVVVPAMINGPPSPSWWCYVFGFAHDLRLPPADRPRFTVARLDVSLEDFRRLRRASRRQQDQLLHWFAGQAGGHPR